MTVTKWKAAVMGVMAAGLVLAACGSGSAPPTAESASVAVPASSNCAAAAKPARGVVTQAVATTRYYMVADVSPEEQMYTPGQVSSMRPSSGEVMMGGRMPSGGPASSMMGGGPSAGTGEAGAGSTRHVEVHICSRSTGRAVSGAAPTITMADTTAGGAPQSMAVAAMQGVDMSEADMHYGNNMTMVAGHHYTITCTLTGQTGTFQMTVP